MVDSPQNFFVQYMDGDTPHFGTEDVTPDGVSEEIYEKVSEEDLDLSSLPVNEKLGLVYVKDGEVVEIKLEDGLVEQHGD